MSRRIGKIAKSLLLFLVSLVITVTWAAAQHGGKAEGKQVRFERGKTSATYQDRVSGAVEVEYELKAERGQELIVRLVSDRPASASVKMLDPSLKPLELSCLAASREIAKQLGLASEASCYESDQQKLKLNGQTWSVSLPESGIYALSVYNPNAESAASAYTLTIIVRPSDKETVSALRTIGHASLDAAMRKFITALKKRDVERFLSLFSRTQLFYANNPLNAMRIAVPYSKLAADIRKKGEWYFTYLERGSNGDFDAFVDNIGKGEMWRRVNGVKFVPPDAGDSSANYVRWRREGGSWVIVEISYPQA